MPRPKRVVVTGVGRYHAVFYHGHLERGAPPPAGDRDVARAVHLTFDAFRIAGEN